MNELNIIYKAILQALGTVIKDNDRIMLKIDSTEIPMTLDEMDVYLPTDNALSNQPDQKVFFHPACESIISRETEIFKIVRRLMGLQLLIAFKKIPVVLAQVANKKSKRSQSESVYQLLEPLRTAKKENLREMENLFGAMEVEYGNDNVDKRIIHFEIIKGGKSRDGEKVYYRCKPSFPFYNEMARRIARNEGQDGKTRMDLFGVSLSLDSLLLAAHVFEAVFPGVNDPEMYQAEQIRQEAARFSVICNCYALVCNDLNRIQSLFRADFDKVGLYNLDISFTTPLESIGDHWRLIPPLPYNDQAGADNSSAVSVNNHQMVSSLMNTQTVQHQQAPVGVQGGPNIQTNFMGQPTQQQVQGSAQDGFRANVMAELAPGETWLGVTFDQSTSNWLHQIQSPTAGVYVKRYSSFGNFLSREYPTTTGMGAMMGFPGMPGMGGMGGMNPMMAGMNPIMQQMMMANAYRQAAAPTSPSGGQVVYPNAVVSSGNDSETCY